MSPPSDDALRHTAHPGEIVGVSEDVWMEVIDKMDQVYSDLLQYEVALEQKNAKLEESQQFILSVLTSMSDIMLVCDRNGIIQDANRSLEAFCGRSVDALRGTSLFELFVDPLAAEEARRRLFGQGAKVHDCELPLRARDGSAVPVSLNCTPRFNAVGKSLGMVVTGRPVGELRRAYQALHEAHEDLKRTQQQLLHAEKMASLGRLVAGVAHELNNPISFVLGNVHALQRYAGRLAGYLGTIHRGAGAEEVEDLGEAFEIQSEASEVVAVRTALQEAGYDYESAEAQFVPATEIEVDVEGARKILKLIDALEDSDDVQNVFANFDASDEVLAALDEE